MTGSVIGGTPFTLIGTNFASLVSVRFGSVSVELSSWQWLHRATAADIIVTR